MRKGARVAAGAFVLGSTILVVASASCVHDGYPLGTAGKVEIRVDTPNIFAADTLDEHGEPIGPRQSPSSTNVTLNIDENDEPAFGAFVKVRVEPSEALTFEAATGEANGPTCDAIEGAFRCTASEQGIAKFVARAHGDFSGDVTIIVEWANQVKEKSLVVLAAGVPPKSTNFNVIGLSDTDRVQATFEALQCTTSAVPDDLGTKWREGKIRSKEIYVRATPPPNAPASIENAPVYIESLSAEGALSMNESCADRTTRLRVLLGASGESERFFACFSDIGGDVSFAVTSSDAFVDPPPKIPVDAEPRLLRVAALKQTVQIGSEIDLFEVSAYNADRVRIPIAVDIASDEHVLELADIEATLTGEDNAPTKIRATPVEEGTAKLHVTPRLLSQPDCVSVPVTVTQ